MKYELLAPAGDRECLESAVLFGADAVYLGGSAFGMRASPKNFSGEELKRAVDFAHSHGVKVYLTCNTIPTNEEADGFPEFIRYAADAGIDAAIVADFGVMEAVKTHAPGMDLHMSTQVGVTNYAAANALHRLGAARVVLARETGLAEIARIKKEAPEELELEAFVHGAMCVSFSGRCLLSSYLVNRDANRGACAQPCRWGYYLMEEKRPGQYFQVVEEEKSSFILNAKDLCMIGHLPALMEAGVSSFKIEGRAKSAYYVAVVTNAYRAAIDAAAEGREVPEWALQEVFRVSHRQYCTGFYFGHPDACQYYENSGYIREYDFVGVVNGAYEGGLEVTQRNYFRASDEIEVVAPGLPPQKLMLSEIRNKNGEPVEIANKATETLYISTGQSFPPHSFLRKPV